MTYVILFQYGKKKEKRAFDLVFLLSELYQMSKARVKRNLKEGAFDVMITEIRKK